MSTYKQLLAQKEALEAELMELRSLEITDVIQQIRSLMAEYDLSIEDIRPKRGRGRPPRGSHNNRKNTTTKSTPPPKYRDPKSGKTWSGRGRAPSWLGTNPKKYLIAEE